MYKIHRLLLIMSLIIFSPVQAQPAMAGATMKDVLIAVRTLGFVTNPPIGPVDFAVIYDPDIPESVTDKDTVYAVLDGGTDIGPAFVKTVPIQITDLSRIKEYRFVLLTSGIDSSISKINSLIRNSGILTISTNLSYVRSGKCVMGVESDPDVKILVSRTASEAASVTFATYFRMMITEL